MALPPTQRRSNGHGIYTFKVICALIFLFLMAPILIVIPLSFNAEPYFTFTDEDAALRSHRIYRCAGMICC
jgi:putative spermidine/putrescine transport system permease protein